MKERNGDGSIDNDGILFLFGVVDGNQCEKICKEIIRLNLKQEQPFIQLIVNSTGGYCSDGFAIIDIINWSRLPVYTTGVGRVASMGLLIFMAGEKGHRVLTPRTSVLSHRYTGMAMGNHSQLVARRVEEDLMHQRIVNHYLQHSSLKSEEEINRKVLRDIDSWLTPEQAVEYGLADVIQTDTKIAYPNIKISTFRGGER